MLVKIAIQKIQDEFKRRNRKKRDETRNVPLSACEHVIDGMQPRPSQVAQGHELEETTHKAMLALAESDRWILDCRDNLRMSFAEIAQELGCRPVNAKLRYHRASKRYRGAIRSLSGGEEARG
jgi:RNA polymerase sigma factor (sigma-70 family)